MNQKEPYIKWDKSGDSIFEKFAAQLEEYTRTQTPPSYGNQDVQYYLELWQKRLKSKELQLEYDFIPRGLFADKSPIKKSWSDDKYINQMECRTCKLTRTLYRNGEKVYKKGQNETFYETITFSKDGNAVLEELYTCPNCGAISKVKELQKGCNYCGTYFEIRDLFPKVTNFYSVKDDSGTETEIKKDIIKFVIPSILIAVIGYSCYFLFQERNPVLAIIQGIFAGGIFGIIFGYVAWAISKLTSLFIGAGRTLGMLVNSAGSGKRFVNFMKQYSPEFSFEYFAGKGVSLLKMIIYTEDVTELPNYVGKPIGNLFSDIVESSYSGAVALKKECEVKGKYVYVTVEVYMEDIYDKNGHIYKKKDKFRLHLYRSIDRPINYNFSIKEIQCKSCGSSFDATKQRTCPNCGTGYEIGDDDWVVTAIEKR